MEYSAGRVRKLELYYGQFYLLLTASLPAPPHIP
jgi:hypothetical protein